ncbi:MAG: ABC transporter permease [Terasakiella sp.]|uniref:ABC transporter permease n=1 Tax=unclassified Terasakiella TaxID=2614952 RepID=UPI003B009411
MSFIANLFGMLFRNRRVIASTTRIELRKRYSGSFFGSLWVFLNPLLFLCIYLFVYLVVFKVRFPGYSDLDYVLYVFSGLVPYLAFMEVIQAASVSIRQNIHLVKNVILPIEIIPARLVLIALIPHLIGLGLVLIIAAINNTLGWHNLYLVIAIVIFTTFLVGLALFMAPLGVLFPDVQQIVGLFTLFLIFVSPIGFRPDMVPGKARIIVDINPIYYMIDMYRTGFGAFGQVSPDWFRLGVALAIALVFLVLGTFFFQRFKAFMTDYE